MADLLHRGPRGHSKTRLPKGTSPDGSKTTPEVVAALPKAAATKTRKRRDKRFQQLQAEAETSVDMAPKKLKKMKSNLSQMSDMPGMDDDDDDEDSDDDEEDEDDDEEDDGIPEDQQKWEEGLAGLEELEEILARVHPKLQDTRKLIPDEHILKAVRERRNPTLRFTAKLMCGVQPYKGGEPLEKGGWTIPRLIVVTGHNGKHGNGGVNGVYQRYPDDHHKRPVYYKALEKRPLPGPGEMAYQSQPLWRPNATRLYSLPAPKFQGSSGMQPLLPGTLHYFLFFDNTLGCWCLGPEVGERKGLCARCPGALDVIPSNLTTWEVWDCGRREWYWHKGLTTVKGGN